MIRADIFNAINKERQRQDELHPGWKGDDHGLSVLMEEVGEVAKALYESRNAKSAAQAKLERENLFDELIQVAAVCVRWVENMPDAEGSDVYEVNNDADHDTDRGAGLQPAPTLGSASE